MDAFGTSQLQRLTGEHTAPCVSVYLPTHPAGEVGQQDPVRLKNLLQAAEVELSDVWMRAAEARRLLQAARDLPNDPAFWDKRSDGLAIFVAADWFECFRLPLNFDELLFINRRFHVKPLLPLLEVGGRFLVLALSQNSVRFFGASRDGIDRLDVAGLPTNMKDALNYTEADRGSQVHSSMRGSLGKQAAVFHGHGGQPDTHKDDLLRFLRLIDSSLKPFLRDERTPMLLAGVEYLLPLYREVNHYPHVVDCDLVGNCDYLSPYELRQKAWSLMEPVFRQASERAAARYRELLGSGKTSDGVEQVLPATDKGRVDTLFVRAGSQVWGVFNKETGEVELHETCQAGDDDLLDMAAVQTLAQRGTVYLLNREQMPSREPLAAVLRY
jgi:hypothetical protein